MWSGGKKHPVGGLGEMVVSQSGPCTPVKRPATSDKLSGRAPSNNVRIKLPSGDSPYVRAKHAQLVDKDPNQAVSLFWAAINNGDRVDSALKDMAIVMKQVDRAEEAIVAIKSLRNLCSAKAQEPLDNVLLDLYRKCGRIDDQIEMLNFKLKMIDEGLAFCGRTKKLARSHGKKFQVSIDQERSRLLGNLAWVYMQSGNYDEAETLYRKALKIKQDFNKQCNLAICLMQTGRLAEAKPLLLNIGNPPINCDTETFAKSYKRATEILMILESQLAPNRKNEEVDLMTPDSTTINQGKWEGFNAEILDYTDLSNDLSLDLSDGCWKVESVGGEFSSPSCSCRSSEYENPSSDIRRGEQDDWPGCGADICSTRWESTSRESLCSPISIGGNMTLELRGPSSTVSEFFVNGDENFGTPVKNRATTYKIPRATLETNEYPLEDDLKTRLRIQSPTPVGLSLAKATKEPGSDALSATIRETFDQRSKNLVEEGSASPRKKDQSQNSDRTSVSISKNLKPEGDYTILNSGRRTWADMVEEEECLPNENLYIDAATNHMVWSCKDPSDEHVLSGKWNLSEASQDENMNSNIFRSAPQRKHRMSQNYSEGISWKLDMVDPKEEGSGSGWKTPRRKMSARRFLSFDQQPKWDQSRDYSNSKLVPVSVNLDDYDYMAVMGRWSSCGTGSNPVQQRNRLRVFQEITLDTCLRD